ncbi:hypothetical protein GCM10023195_01410 [Actinoallomurus liliacearum]|uniref:Uncharacterized protein n=1 Tax=Actinoallomurus liliacearum TaxID=1080073 RepID=A0ABP8TB05_9ACTN
MPFSWPEATAVSRLRSRRKASWVAYIRVISIMIGFPSDGSRLARHGESGQAEHQQGDHQHQPGDAQHSGAVRAGEGHGARLWCVRGKDPRYTANTTTEPAIIANDQAGQPKSRPCTNG